MNNVEILHKNFSSGEYNEKILKIRFERGN